MHTKGLLFLPPVATRRVFLTLSHFHLREPDLCLGVGVERLIFLEIDEYSGFNGFYLYRFIQAV